MQRAIGSNGASKEQYVLRNYNIDIQFFITKSRTGHLFFFFKRKKRPSEVVIDISLQFTVRPVLENSQVGETVKADIFKWQLPPFLVLHPKRRQRILAGITGEIPEKPLILTDGRQNYLLIAFKQRRNEVKQMIRPKADIWFENKQVEAQGNGQWSARPFLLMYTSIRSWIANDWVHPDQVPIRLEEDNDVHFVLRTLVEAFRESKVELAKNDSFSNALAPFLDQYNVRDFRAKLLLRLDEIGNFAEFDSRHSYQLGLEMEMVELPSHTEARLSMNIPDFLISGELFEAFWDLFLYDDAAKDRREKLCNALPKQGLPKPDEEQLFDFLQSGKKNASVFRIDRDRRIDSNLFFISGNLNGTPVTLIFSGQFEVLRAKPPKILPRNNERLDIHYFAREHNGNVDQKFVNYFLRMMWYFNNWMEIL